MLNSCYRRLHNCLIVAASPRRQAEEGQGMVEYALILVLVAIVVIVILTLVGHSVSDVFSNVNNGLSG
ncbi:MAG: Flp family type IVb pilin [Candidatus Dormiibacterota bacterium]